MSEGNTCGVGGWGGPVPGDPSNNSVLQATPAFGGIDVTWNLPTTNPHAVAYTLVYRGLVNDFNAAILLKEVAGTFYFDRLEAAVQYFYWIKIVSRNGTIGNLIGPSSAVAKPTIEGMIELLTGEIDNGLLATSLKNQLDQISILNTNLLNEVTNRETGEVTLAQAMAGVSAGVAQANTFILAEIATRTTENSALAESIDGVVVTLGGDIAAVTTTMTATVAVANAASTAAATAAGAAAAVTTTVNALYTAKVTVNGLVGGFGLANNGTEVEAGFDVDKFWVGRTSADKRKPFIIVDGVTYIDIAVIPDASIGNLKIGNYIKSNDFNGVIDAAGSITAPGTVGWAIGKGGNGMVIDAVHIRNQKMAAATLNKSLMSSAGTAFFATNQPFMSLQSSGYVAHAGCSGTFDVYMLATATAPFSVILRYSIKATHAVSGLVCRGPELRQTVGYANALIDPNTGYASISTPFVLFWTFSGDYWRSFVYPPGMSGPPNPPTVLPNVLTSGEWVLSVDVQCDSLDSATSAPAAFLTNVTISLGGWVQELKGFVPQTLSSPYI